MKLCQLDPPRSFSVGSINIKHSANIELDVNEQVTFVTASGTEYDVVRKSWGYYATPSINGRLIDHGLCAVLVRNASGKIYLLLVEEQSKVEFDLYLEQEGLVIISWLTDFATEIKDS
jgi:hypothetical protein